MAPLAAPKLPPGRLYFLFQQPIHTSPADLQVGGGALLRWRGTGLFACCLPARKAAAQLALGRSPSAALGRQPRAYGPLPPASPQDRQRCDDMYRATKASVEEGIAWLLHKRKQDPYGEFLPRQLYEAAYRGRQAPTFPLN